MSPSTREICLWVVLILLVVLGVLGWLIATAPEEDILPSQYRYGVL